MTYFSKSSFALASFSSSWKPYSDSNSLVKESLLVSATAGLGALVVTVDTAAVDDFSSFLAYSFNYFCNSTSLNLTYSFLSYSAFYFFAEANN